MPHPVHMDRLLLTLFLALAGCVAGPPEPDCDLVDPWGSRWARCPEGTVLGRDCDWQVGDTPSLRICREGVVGCWTDEGVQRDGVVVCVPPDEDGDCMSEGFQVCAEVTVTADPRDTSGS